MQACLDEFAENEDLPNTTNPDDWAKISGKKGERIVFIRTLISSKQGTQPGRSSTCRTPASCLSAGSAQARGKRSPLTCCFFLASPRPARKQTSSASGQAGHGNVVIRL